MKVALVTGGGKGIGAAICRRLSEDYAVIINYNKSEKQAKALEKELREKGKTAEAVFADITDLKDIKKMIDYIISRYHKIDALVNNSGVSSYSLVQLVFQVTALFSSLPKTNTIMLWTATLKAHSLRPRKQLNI